MHSSCDAGSTPRHAQMTLLMDLVYERKDAKKTKKPQISTALFRNLKLFDDSGDGDKDRVIKNSDPYHCDGGGGGGDGGGDDDGGGGVANRLGWSGLVGRES
ncbi:hypothetical protein HZH68_007724 [Vespula germanica]|uniref:Uncharacterized protein n=1 Tax=Vespula germanica TaxID=30212 RepID=A0A834K496_VESGE|nr:hypothetical protein HZH68_007724 [Vespula germanica]